MKFGRLKRHIKIYHMVKKNRANTFKNEQDINF